MQRCLNWRNHVVIGMQFTEVIVDDLLADFNELVKITLGTRYIKIKNQKPHLCLLSAFLYAFRFRTIYLLFAW